MLALVAGACETGVHANRAPLKIAAAAHGASGPVTSSAATARRRGASTQPTDTAEPSAPTPSGPPYAVQDEAVVLIDPTRTTPARGTVPAIPGRTLRTVIRRPAGVEGPLPLVVFAHGYNTDPETYETLIDSWAAAGYLVAAPDCPGSASDLPGAPVSDYAAQARDLSFVITAMLSGRDGPVNPSEIAVAGHSDGGTAVAIMALNPVYADLRVKAYLNLAGQIPPDVPGPWATSRTPGALLVAVGTNDRYDGLVLSSAMYHAAPMTKALLVVPGGDHLETFVSDTPIAASVRAATVRFLASAFAAPGDGLTPQQLAAALAPAGSTEPYSVSEGS
jgi:dienelactone hydrolase